LGSHNLPRETRLFRAWWVAVRALLRPLFCFRAEGLERLPAGPAVLVANHPSALDPLFLAAAVPERLVFLAAAEFLALPAVGWAMRTYGCIPVRRGEVDSRAVRGALLALEAGRKVAVFPEGRVTPHPDGRPGLRGAALLAARAGVPVVPVAIAGTGRVFPLGAWFPRPGRVAVRIGPPLPPPDAERASQDAATEAAMAWIHAHSAR
jgi:1-acyl-sn-glycerol-3-phosphate acyltransferase